VSRINLNTTSLNNEVILQQPVYAMTCVASNGIVLFQLTNDAEHWYWGRCEDGSIVSVPFPVPSDAKKLYKNVPNPRITLAHSGHIALFPVELWSAALPFPQPHLVIVNCAANTMDVLDVDAFVKQETKIRRVEWYGENLLVNSDGSCAWMTVLATNADDSKEWLLLQQKDGLFTTIGSARTDPMMLVGLDERNGTVLVRTGDTLMSYRAGNATPVLLNIPSSLLGSAKQFSNKRGECVVLGSSGIEIRETSTGSILRVVVSTDTLRARNLIGEFRNIWGLQISQDGEWIAFGFIEGWCGTPPVLSRLFTVRRDGKYFKEVAHVFDCTAISVSDAVPAK